MAYLDRSFADETRLLFGNAAQPAVLSRIERETILVSRGDRAASVAAEKGLPRLIQWMFGFEPQRGLANSRLEALRRYAVLYRLKGDALEIGEFDRLQAAGYSINQVALVRSLIDRMPSSRGHSSTWWFALATALICAGAAVAIGNALLTRYLDDGLVGLILIGAIFVTVTPLFTAVSGKRPAR